MAIKRRRSKKLTKEQIRSRSSWQYLPCRECGVRGRVAGDAIGLLCSNCLQAKIPPPEEPTKPSGRPRGWHFKLYFEFEGKIYSKGEEITDKKQIAALKKEAKKTKRKNDDNTSE